MRQLAQKIGAGFLLGALVVAFMGQPWTALAILLGVGILDIVLVMKDKDTISNWIHELFDTRIDKFIIIGFLVYVYFTFGPVAFLPYCIGAIIGHLFGDW